MTAPHHLPDGADHPTGQSAALARLTRAMRSFDGERARSVEYAAALLATGAAVLMRLATEALVSGVVPFTFTFPAVILATLFAGALAGSLTAIGCQLLTIMFVFPYWTATHGGMPTNVASLLVSSVSLGMMIWAISSFRQLSRRLRSRCEREVRTLSLLIGEMDHRTKNNFQIAASLLGNQAHAADDTEVAFQLNTAATRLTAMASLYRSLSLAARDGGFSLALYLDDLVNMLRESVLPPNVTITSRLARVDLDAHLGLMVGLIVNEWVINAVKYAFNGQPGVIAVRTSGDAAELAVEVVDDGTGTTEQPVAGTGSRLVTGLAEAIGATIAIRRDGGTSCTLRMPLHRRAEG